MNATSSRLCISNVVELVLNGTTTTPAPSPSDDWTQAPVSFYVGKVNVITQDVSGRMLIGGNSGGIFVPDMRSVVQIPTVNGPIYAAVFDSDTNSVILGGTAFSTFGSVVNFSIDSSSLGAFGAISGPVYAIAQSPITRDWFFGGSFSMSNGIGRLVRYNKTNIDKLHVSFLICLLNHFLQLF